MEVILGQIQLSSENVDKVNLGACVFHRYLRNYFSVEDCVIGKADAPSPFSYDATFRRSVGRASEEAVTGI
jgi:non-canonical (house-cleaning) NTP pyrophosphatase